jgi:hypothetical protein
MRPASCFVARRFSRLRRPTPARQHIYDEFCRPGAFAAGILTGHRRHQKSEGCAIGIGHYPFSSVDWRERGRAGVRRYF